MSAAMTEIDPKTLIAFWRGAGPKAWFAKRDAFDQEIRARFEAVHHAAARGELTLWQTSAEGSLGSLLLLDQFPRNLWRGSAHAFATDPLARSIARRSIAAGFDHETEAGMRNFFYLPFAHAESLDDQVFGLACCVELEREAGVSALWARRHHAVIARFGRFPHRNASLGRETTPEEQAFLDEGGFSG